MNVVCGQCGTGYEFDDALVSERGTTVRCTQCGFQFRVRPTRSGATGPERWIVRKTTGEEYIFRTLSELQRAIGQQRVVIDDSLSRDGSVFRPMRELSELDCFFGPAHKQPEVAGRSSQPGARSEPAPVRRPDPMAITPTAHIAVPDSMALAGQFAHSDQHGAPAPGAMPTPGTAYARHVQRRATPPGGFATQATEAVAAVSPVPGHGPSSPRAAAPMKSPFAGNTQPTAQVQHGSGQPPVSPNAPLYRHEARPSYEPQAPPPRPAGSPAAPDLTLESERQQGINGVAATPEHVDVVVMDGPLPRRRRGNRGHDGALDPTLAANSGQFPTGAAPSSGNAASSHVPPPMAITPPERSVGPRWILGLVLLGGLGLIAGTVGRDYFEQFRDKGAPAVADNSRVEAFISQGDELYRAGDLEEARAQFDKASALAEGSPEVALRLLRIEATRADVEWLRLKLVAADSAEAQQAKQALAERAAKLADRSREFQTSLGNIRASQASAEGVAALVDALRLEGDVSKARALVESSVGLGNEPYSAYVSAMLDVAEPNPSWDSVISRLKVAVSGERGLGRAQAALVFALTQSGDIKGAQQQLDILAGFKRSSPLLEPLRQFVSRAAAEPAASSDSQVPPLPVIDSPKAQRPNDDTVIRSSDPMQEAAEARAAGELARAGRLYTLALSQQPGNAAAMTGLGDVARSQGNTDIALSHYGAALRQNPNYAPAILSCADLKWATGDRSGAVELYRRLGAGAPERVAQRVSEYDGSSSKATVTAPANGPASDPVSAQGAVANSPGEATAQRAQTGSSPAPKSSAQDTTN